MKFRPEHFITDVSGKYPRLWALKGANPIDVCCGTIIHQVSLLIIIEKELASPREHVGEVVSEDTNNEIKYPSFHFMKLQRPDKKAFTYIKEQETKPALVVNLTEDEISTRRAWGVWVCITEMDKV
ncbi:hypothetical protein ACS0TY_007374 [Phlomoides rotata]